MRKRQRLIFVLVMLGCVTLAAILAGYALRAQVSLFFTPVEAIALRTAADKRVDPARDFRLGGLVLEGSVAARTADLTVAFTITDRAAEVPVVYRGVLPDLFREGQGVIVTGTWATDGLFTAHTLLAKHDENYMPPEVAKGLDKVKASDVEKLKQQGETP